MNKDLIRQGITSYSIQFTNKVEVLYMNLISSILLSIMTQLKKIIAIQLNLKEVELYLES
ncbi:hypothetical protein [Paraclostridium sordellii]|uniref:hypothetical protein n=1 Tax=Paraclostridium sordellii TaxID=1505 RepID=UPI0005E8D5EF|nr:hypothetical protein [Paeniclostridium sordellii]CEQ26775.1 Uncharacterised protein [[Clostridium] sordellii] [Paeniclostridium sordellii]